MGTYYALKEEHTRKQLEEIGVLFLDGVLEEHPGITRPYVWIVNELPVVKGQTQHLHPNFTDEGFIYGFTRYGSHSTDFLEDILEANMVEYVDEYSLQEMCIPTEIASTVLGIELNEENNDVLANAILDIFYESHDMYFSPNKTQFVLDWLETNKDELLNSYNEQLEMCD
jgi:hypothetical protein